MNKYDGMTLSQAQEQFLRDVETSSRLSYETPTLKVKLLDKNGQIPCRAHKDDCGLDLFTLEGAIIKPGDGHVFTTGIAAEFKTGYCGMLTDRSSMAKRGFKLAGGIIDPGYTGELKVVLRNVTNHDLSVKAGDKIAQLLLLPMITPEVVIVEELEESERGERGFGSSGV